MGRVAAGFNLETFGLKIEAGGKSGLHMAERRVTPGGGNPRDSATESKPPSVIGLVRVKGCGKSAPRFSGNGSGKVNPVRSKTK